MQFDNNNLALKLTMAETDLSHEQFVELLNHEAEAHPTELHVLPLQGKHADTILIFGAHTDGRTDERTELTSKEFIDIAQRLLSNELVFAKITQNPVFYDDVTKRIVDFNDTHLTSTAVIDVQSGYVFVMEAGFTYVRVKTIWRISDHFMVRDDTTLLRVDGENISDDVLSILRYDEVFLSRKRYETLRAFRAQNKRKQQNRP